MTFSTGAGSVLSSTAVMESAAVTDCGFELVAGSSAVVVSSFAMFSGMIEGSSVDTGGATVTSVVLVVFGMSDMADIVYL